MKNRMAVLIASALGLGIGIGTSNAAPLTVPGGELDASIAAADVYVGVPVAATPSGGAACRRAARYVENINAGRFSDVADLFSENAVVLDPSHHRVIGSAMISDFYQNTIAKIKPQLIAVSYLGDSSQCMVTLAVRIDLDGRSRYKIASVDQFTLEATGKFSRMVAYVRP
jgi:ketosteroid isomerase-like protein